MNENRWFGRPPRKRRSLTKQEKRAQAAPDLVGRAFWAPRTDQRWCGDVTYIDTAEGTL